MIQQDILPFKLETTGEEITPRSGLAIYAEALRALGVDDLAKRYLPVPGSNRGYESYKFLEPLLLMLYGGGRHLEDLREIGEDKALKRLLKLKQMPASSTVGDWLVRMGQKGGEKGLEEINRKVIEQVLGRDERDGYILDVDATVIEAEKEEAKWTYKKVKGYQPILAFLAETPLCLTYEFREGNVSAGAFAIRFLEKCKGALPSGKSITHLRSDSAFYQAEVINWLIKNGIKFTITADQDQAVKEAISTIKETDWKRLKMKDGTKTDREVAITVHTMNKTNEAFTLVVKRWRNPQMNLFEPNEWCYQAIATNIDDLKIEEIVWHHNARGQAENLIKELKIGFGMEQMVSGDFGANAIYFSIGVLAYNTAYAQKKLFMPQGWLDKTIATLRWRLINTAGKVVRHGRRVILKIVASWEKLKILLEMRNKCLKFSLSRE